MQSGRGKASDWIMEYDNLIERKPEPLMGWTYASGTTDQVQITFDSLEQAKTYAEEKGIEFTVRPTSTRKVRPRNYSDNFKYIPPEDDK
jgi:hypothetical protein